MEIEKITKEDTEEISHVFIFNRRVNFQKVVPP